jgi:drug/metabolite transporter (DMT)-like permease
VLVALIWGTTFPVVKHAIQQISTSYFLALRFWLATVCMALLFWRGLRVARWNAIRRGLAGGMAAGVFLWLGYLLQTVGLKYTSAANSGFLTGLYIVLVPLFGAAVFRRWPQRREMLGVVLAALGMALMTLPGAGRAFSLNRGDLYTLGCASAFAVHLLLLGHFSQRELFEAVAVGQIACTAALSTFALAFEPPSAEWTPSLAATIVLTGVFATALAFGTQTWAQRFTTPTRTALIFSLEPVFALATAVVLGGERLALSAFGGAGLILAGVLAVELKPAARR